MPNPRPLGFWIGLIAIGLIGAVQPAPAQSDADADADAAETQPSEQPAAEEDPADDTQPPAIDDEALPSGELTTTLPGTTVIGSDEQAAQLPGSGYYVDTEEIRQQSYDDVNRILRQVPGVYLREEDGYGLFPNISLRGVDPARSAKVTIMEDGILQAPAPYSAPSAYYSPTAGRMDAIEILKGSSQIRYGPHITGGVINYLSTPVPEQPTGYLKTMYGQENEIRIHAYQGQTFETDQWGRVGYVVEGYLRRTDGFKEFDPKTPDFRGGDTGFINTEPMVKLRWEPDSLNYHRFEVKYGYTDRDGKLSYLGQSEEDFNEDPYDRYPATRFDEINTYQNRSYIKHYGEWTNQLSSELSLYYNNFHRNWSKLHTVNDNNMSHALAEEGEDLAVLRGEEDGEFNVRDNNRDYYSWGVQFVPQYEFALGATDHLLEFGVRYHEDRIRRFQWSTDYTQDGNGNITNRDVNAKGSAGNRRQETNAVALHLRDEISFGRWTVTPGIRFEHLDLKWTEFEPNPSNTVDEREEGTLDVLGGGIGLTYDWTDEWQIFGGVHRGFSTPSPRARLNDGLAEETSISLEGGVRYRTPKGGFMTEATGFYTHFDDLIGVDIAGGTGTDEPANVGEIDTAGLEFRAEYDPGLAYDWGFSMPNFASFTYTNAELASEATGDPGSIFSGGEKGNKVPYIPEYQLTLGTGLEFDETWGVFLLGSFVDEVFTTASNTDEQVDRSDESNPQPDARYGKLDAHFVVDVSAYYRLNDNAKLLGGVHNLFGEEYTASRLPHGPRPGKPRFAYLGLEIDF